MERYYNYQAFVQRFTNALNIHRKTEKKEFILKRGCQLATRFDLYSRNELFTNWSENFNINKKILENWSKGDFEVRLTPTEKLQEFLSSFDILENSITKELIISKGEKIFTFDELLIEAEEQKLSTKNITKILDVENKNITVVQKFNPLKDFFEEVIENYNGEPVISKLSKTITAYNFEDKRKTEYYQKRLEYYLHKWLCMAAGQGLGLLTNNAMLLLIEGVGGSGKTYIWNWLFSLDIFKEMYYVIGENESFKNWKNLANQKFAINWDELPLQPQNYQAFKSNIAATELRIYNKKNKKYEYKQRNVNYCGSTNKTNRAEQRGYLLDEDLAMQRRIIPLEIIGRINYKEYLKLDLKQLWGEAASSILAAHKTNNQNLLSWECDWEDLRKENQKYIDTRSKDFTSVMLQMFKSVKEGEGELMSSSEIYEAVKQTGVNCKHINIVGLGKILGLNGFIQKRKGYKRGWWVKKK